MPPSGTPVLPSLVVAASQVVYRDGGTTRRGESGSLEEELYQRLSWPDLTSLRFWGQQEEVTCPDELYIDITHFNSCVQGQITLKHICTHTQIQRRAQGCGLKLTHMCRGTHTTHSLCTHSRVPPPTFCSTLMWLQKAGYSCRASLTSCASPVAQSFDGFSSPPIYSTSKLCQSPLIGKVSIIGGRETSNFSSVVSSG